MRFGDRIHIKGYIIRHKSDHNRWWSRHNYPEPKEGIFIRNIRLANGDCEWDHHGIMGEEGSDYIFSAKKYIKGAWVARKDRKPEKVFLEDCELIDVN